MPREFVLTHNNMTLSLKEWGKLLGISYQAMYKRFQKYNDDPAIFTPGNMAHKHPLKPRKHELVVGGEEHTKEEWEKITGVPWDLLAQRKYREMPLERIISKTLIRSGKPKRLVTYNNETHSHAEWARILNISRERVRQRLRDYSVEEALSLIPHQRRIPSHNKTYGGKPTKRIIALELLKENGRES